MARLAEDGLLRLVVDGDILTRKPNWEAARPDVLENADIPCYTVSIIHCATI